MGRVPFIINLQIPIFPIILVLLPELNHFENIGLKMSDEIGREILVYE